MDHIIDHPAPPSLVAQIGSLYHRIHKVPLQMDQIPVLMNLFYSGGSSQKAVGMNLGRDKASINRTISILLKKDVVKVIPDTTDKRKTHVELTVNGKKLAKQADAILGKFDVTLSSKLTEEERKEFDQTMLKLIGIVTPH
jgi:DNA-binding MarR family transcriptional regulator